jgi:glucose-1-phosphate cytidylyltransferase
MWHIMNVFARQGFTDFIVAGGYRLNAIEDYFSRMNDGWSISVIDTGLQTQTGGRIKQCLELIDEDRCFVTYGDGLANISLTSLLEFHYRKKLLVTVTGVRPPARFGVISSKRGTVTKFSEKGQADSGVINGGFFVLERAAKNFILGDLEPFETGAIPRLVDQRQLACYLHEGFWKPMDTFREKLEFEQLAMQNPPPWLRI